MKIVIIGAGYSGLTAAAWLAHQGHNVTVLEKHSMPGGRARIINESGFRFDIGPSWYMMPEIFDRFFEQLGRKRSDYYNLIRLDPSYRIFWGKDDAMDIASEADAVAELFESIEPGAGEQFRRYLADAQYKYEMASKDFLYQRFGSVLDLLKPSLIFDRKGYDILRNFHKHSLRFFKNDRLVKIVEWMITFLGSSPYNAPAIYSLIAHAEFNLGIYYPEGGLYSVSDGLARLAQDTGAKIVLNADVRHITVKDGRAVSVETHDSSFAADAVLSSADYAFTELNLLDAKDRTYNERYWAKKTYSPSSLLFYVGINKQLKNVLHHNLYLDEKSDWQGHFDSLYGNLRWPEDPMFYLSVTSKTDPTVAPEGSENLVFLIPVAPGIEDTEEIREKYFENIVSRFEDITGETIRDAIVVKKSYAINDFERDYGAYKGNAFGLAHTLFQTANFRPDNRSKKVRNLSYAGCMTQPGIGTPLSIISGEVAGRDLLERVS
ncbi:MAG: zeta-carotene-forming phytoene desaturase [candidate division WS6 bacterium OLB20]|uniref:Zeta-carotene-forming phytoene desaturase n=1 Tax=candidate division WS6 bacterium OLB20 TaxID=1617426 RepID=A0A136LZ53_9BACT|nr:MAG: zeta-carotene-forming phytoene desaturase [candidate division WS6 bacterium OLB20]